MAFYDIDRDAPEMCASRGRIVGVDRTHDAGKSFFATHENDATEHSNDQCQSQPRFHGRTLNSWLFLPCISLPVTTLESHRRDQKEYFSDEANDATPRV